MKTGETIGLAAHVLSSYDPTTGGDRIIWESSAMTEMMTPTMKAMRTETCNDL